MTPEPEWVDLGLPSGLLWARCNVGAKLPIESGLFFSWGNTDGHRFGDGYSFSTESYAETPGASVTTDLDLEHDAANQIMGDGWRIPSRSELQELITKTTQERITLRGVNGYLFKSLVNGNGLFLPAAGDILENTLRYPNEHQSYWSATVDNAEKSYILLGEPAFINASVSFVRYVGRTIRAVRSA